MTLLDIVKQAFVKNGLASPGEALSAELGALALIDANLLIQEWNIRDVLVYTTDIQVFTLTARTPPTIWYEIGPTAADFVTARPLNIKRANLIWQQSTPSVRIPITIIDDLQWSDQPVPEVASNTPTTLYNEGSYPNSRLYLWPYPNTTGNQLELFVTHQVAEFATLADTFSQPPGFANAFMMTLAERTLQGFRDVPMALSRAAAGARARFASLNAEPPKLSTMDNGLQSRGGINNSPSANVFSGWNGR
jgi:hypothetical protein